MLCHSYATVVFIVEIHFLCYWSVQLHGTAVTQDWQIYNCTNSPLEVNCAIEAFSLPRSLSLPPPSLSLFAYLPVWRYTLGSNCDSYVCMLEPFKHYKISTCIGKISYMFKLFCTKVIVVVFSLFLPMYIHNPDKFIIHLSSWSIHDLQRLINFSLFQKMFKKFV